MSISLNHWFMTPVLATLLLFTGTRQCLAQEAPEGYTEDVHLLVLAWDLKGYKSDDPFFSVRLTNQTADTVWVLMDKGSGHPNVPGFFKFLREPEYELSEPSIGALVPKEASFIRAFPPKSHEHFIFELNYSLDAGPSFQGDKFRFAIEYDYNRKRDLENALARYPETASPSYSGPLRAEMRPYFEKLTDLKIRTFFIRDEPPHIERSGSPEEPEVEAPVFWDEK